MKLILTALFLFPVLGLANEKYFDAAVNAAVNDYALDCVKEDGQTVCTKRGQAHPTLALEAVSRTRKGETTLRKIRLSMSDLDVSLRDDEEIIGETVLKRVIEAAQSEGYACVQKRDSFAFCSGDSMAPVCYYRIRHVCKNADGKKMKIKAAVRQDSAFAYPNRKPVILKVLFR